MRRRPLITSLALAALIPFAFPSRAADVPAAAQKVTYQDHVLPIFRNTCLNCHNPDKKKGNLDLSSYTGMSAGGGGGKVVEPGDPDSSKLFKAVTWAEEPNMPPKGDKISDKEIAVIRAWIAGGAPETSGSKVAINKPKTNLAVVAVTGKPTGPVAMPKDLSIEPVTTARHPAALTALAASPWAPVIAIGGQRQIVLYHADTLELLGVLPYPEGIAYTLKFSTNGSLLLAGGGIGAKTGKVVAFDVASGKRVAEVGDEFDAVIAADVSPDQTQVALGTPLRTLKIYNTADGSQEHAIKKHTDWVEAVAYSPDGRFLASGDRAGGLWVWEAKTAREVYNCAGHKEGITDACFRGDSSILASASQDGTIKLWNMTDGTMAKTIQAHAGGAMSVAFTHDGRIVSCGRDRLVKIWGPDGTAIKSFEPFSDLALRATVSADGNRVVAGDFTGAIHVWNVADGKRAGDLTANPPTAAQQLAGFEQRMKDLQAALDKANAELKAAQDNANQVAKDLKAATDAQAAATKAIEAGKAQLATVMDDVTAKSKAAKESLSAKQAAVEAATAARAKAKAAITEANPDLKELKAKLATQRASAQEAATAASRAKAKADAKPDDKDLAAKAEEKAQVATAQSAAVDASEKAIAAKTEEIKSLAEALVKSEPAIKAATEALAEAKAASKLTVETSPQVAAAKQALAKAKTDLDAATKAIAARNQATKPAADRLALAQAGATSAAAQIQGAKGQKARLEASAAKMPAKTKG
jgi:hypothetical protein